MNLLTGALDEVFTRTDAGGAWSPLFDGLGSTLALADSTGTVQTQYTYEPFGKTTAGGAASSNSSQYTGRENDGTGLYYYRARYYSPSLQRFINEDPIGLLGGINQYGYVDNNPISYNDPYGLKPHNPGDDPQKSEPTYFDALFGDGGVFTRPTFEEFISAKERARQPCKPFGERWLDSFSETNKAIPGFAAPIGTTLITSPGAAQLTGQPGVLGYALRGGGPGLGGSIVQSGLVAIATHASFEGGIAVGSYANAIGAPCGY